MIKINLLAEKKQSKASKPTMNADVSAVGRNAALAAIVILGFLVSGGWWWSLNNQEKEWDRKHAEADIELARLEEIRAKGEEYKRKKELLARKINLITELKKMQAVPVHILDKVSKNLPDFVWLSQMNALNNQIRISGKATTFNAVSTFYNNMSGSGYFDDVTLGKTTDNKEGVSFSLTCRFAGLGGSKKPATPDNQDQG